MISLINQENKLYHKQKVCLYAKKNSALIVMTKIL